MMRELVIGFTFLAVAGCVTLSAQFAPSRTAQTYTMRTPPEQIEMFRSQVPSKKFIEVGIVSACCGGNTGFMIEMLKKKASETGGDAIMAIEFDATGTATASVIRYE